MSVPHESWRQGALRDLPLPQTFHCVSLTATVFRGEEEIGEERENTDWILGKL